MKILGVMTGTSCDGLDSACVEFESDGWRPVWEASVTYPKKLRTRVLEFQKPDSKHSLESLLALDRDLGDWYARTLSQMVTKQKSKPSVIACHGQTVAHFPSAKGKLVGTSLQLGDPTQIAQRTGLCVVSHFRQGDLAAGGQGAPLVPYFHRALVMGNGSGRKYQGGVAIHNLGGVSNLTYLGPKDLVLAFDTGPGNYWIDATVRDYSGGRMQFDRGGQIALSHSADLKCVARALKHGYFKSLPPKSTGRDEFSDRVLEKLLPLKSGSGASRLRSTVLGNRVATATQITASSIVDAYKRFVLAKGYPLEVIYLTGGGAKNDALTHAIQDGLPEVRVESIMELGVDPQYVEAQAFAFLGYLSLLGQPIGGPWTGARQFGPPGQLTIGHNWASVRSQMWRSGRR